MYYEEKLIDGVLYCRHSPTDKWRSVKQQKENIYNTVTVKASVGGWIVTEKGEDTRIFVRWNDVVRYLESRLTTKTLPDY